MFHSLEACYLTNVIVVEGSKENILTQLTESGWTFSRFVKMGQNVFNLAKGRSVLSSKMILECCNIKNY